LARFFFATGLVLICVTEVHARAFFLFKSVCVKRTFVRMKHRVHMLFPQDLRDAIARSAEQELRSFTGEVCKRLRESLRREQRRIQQRPRNEVAPEAGTPGSREARYTGKTQYEHTRRTASPAALSND
jgi:hypothetical protein